jgi:hypothetical protein
VRTLASASQGATYHTASSTGEGQKHSIVIQELHDLVTSCLPPFELDSAPGVTVVTFMEV